MIAPTDNAERPSLNDAHELLTSIDSDLDIANAALVRVRASRDRLAAGVDQAQAAAARVHDKGNGNGGDPGIEPNAGWPTFPGHVTSRLVYVDSVLGDDTADGRSPDRPLRTLDAARRCLTNNFPDQVLLRRGRVWRETLVSKGSGLSREAPRVFGHYGPREDPLPLICPPNGSPGFSLTSGSDSFIVIDGLHFKATPGPLGASGIKIVDDRGEFIRLIGCIVEDFTDNIQIDGSVTEEGLVDVLILRSLVLSARAASETGRSQGIYAANVTRLVIEESFFDHNGWLHRDPPSMALGLASNQNHNIYLQSDCEEAAVVNTIISRPSANGLQMRGGGTIADNLFNRCPIGAHVSRGTSVVRGNVGLDQINIHLANAAGWFLEFKPCRAPDDDPDGFGVTVENNLAIRQNGRTMHPAFRIGASPNGVGRWSIELTDNIAAGWVTAFDYDPAIPEDALPTDVHTNNSWNRESEAIISEDATLTGWAKAHGFESVTDDDEAIAALVGAWERMLHDRTWDESLTAAAIAAWLRERVQVT